MFLPEGLVELRAAKDWNTKYLNLFELESLKTLEYSSYNNPVAPNITRMKDSGRQYYGLWGGLPRSLAEIECSIPKEWLDPDFFPPGITSLSTDNSVPLRYLPNLVSLACTGILNDDLPLLKTLRLVNLKIHFTKRPNVTSLGDILPLTLEYLEVLTEFRDFSLALPESLRLKTLKFVGRSVNVPPTVTSLSVSHSTNARTFLNSVVEVDLPTNLKLEALELGYPYHVVNPMDYSYETPAILKGLRSDMLRDLRNLKYSYFTGLDVFIDDWGSSFKESLKIVNFETAATVGVLDLRTIAPNAIDVTLSNNRGFHVIWPEYLQKLSVWVMKYEEIPEGLGKLKLMLVGTSPQANRPPPGYRFTARVWGNLVNDPSVLRVIWDGADEQQRREIKELMVWKNPKYD